jgi:hypothetical protein
MPRIVIVMLIILLENVHFVHWPEIPSTQVLPSDLAVGNWRLTSTTLRKRFCFV